MRCKECNHYTQGKAYAGGRCPLMPKRSLFPEDYCLAKRIIPGTEGYEQPKLEACFEKKKPKPEKAKPEVDPQLPPDPDEEYL